jgi:hypothetical protein
VMTNPPVHFPTNDAEFKRLIEGIDDDLKRKGIPIFRRPIDAVGEVCKALNISLRITSDAPAVPGVFSQDSLPAHISEWYHKRYGDRLKFEFSPGSVVGIVKGDLWKIKFPLIYGKVKLCFDPDLDKYKNSPDVAINQPLLANPLRCFVGLTSELARSLTRQEMLCLSKFYVNSLEAIQRLSEIRSEPFISEARSDLNSAVENIIQIHPSYGQSKWSSLQFVEKLFKSYLKIKNGPFPKIHDLNKLASLAINKGLPSFNLSLLDDIQCDPGVRYGDIPVTQEEAIKAHHASLKICSLLVHIIKNDVPELLGTQAALKSSPKIIPGLFYVSSIPNNYYYCEYITGEIIKWNLVESYQHGNLIQVEFRATIEQSINYRLLTDPFEIIRLKPILQNLMESRVSAKPSSRER